MLQNIITYKKNLWLNSPDCSIKPLVDYIRNTGGLRDTQVEAIEQYLFLKIKGENKPLWQLFSEGFFINGDDLSKVNINETARKFLESNISARALFEFSRMKKNGGTLLPDLEKLIVVKVDKLDYDSIIKSIFYNVSYADYLFSLPMGAGKTYLMAAFIYLDLYFAQNEPDNKNFAHNFLVLVPSGLKSSIVPSLKTIENFEPTWVLQEPAASELKKKLKFEVLDQPKSGKKSNKARNPNAKKVNQYLSQSDLMGLVLVVNAEKVILERIDVVQVGESYKVDFHETDDEKDKYANELRNLIGKIPNLEIMIDEVHHAATDEVKLRQVVNKWNAVGNVTTVLGFSGTPYLSSPDSVPLDEKNSLRFSQITNTVYYYPLIDGIKSFLKKPKVEIAFNLEPMQIIEKGVADFYEQYKNTKYENGSIAKLAIYCGKIERLENEIYPALAKLVAKFGDNEQNILKYHKGNNEFKLPKENELEYVSLDQPFSNKRIVLLVQIGKEGWDCRSLTGVILSQKGDCPTNMVLQTSCRCLRQVDKGKEETALVWLNEQNATTLNKQLKEEQQTSIEELNRAAKTKSVEEINRFSRMDFLELPLVDFYDLKVEYKTIEVETEPNTEKKLADLLKNIDKFKTNVVIQRRQNFTEEVVGGTQVITEQGLETASLESWLSEIVKESFSTISFPDLNLHRKILEQVFSKIIYKKKKQTVFNSLFNRYEINSKVRLAFSAKRSLETETETVPKNAQLLITENLNSFPKNDKFFPTVEEANKILNLDKSISRDAEVPDSVDGAKAKAGYEQLVRTFKEMGMESNAPKYEEFRKQFEIPFAARVKNKTFHYLPYNFWQSNFEKKTLEEILGMKEFVERKLEVYYNGERGLTEFEIKCFAKQGKYWRNIGKYTPDFLIVKRNKKALHKILILETKGEGFASKPDFVKKKKYVETEFLKENNDKFGYKRFDFLYLQDDEPMPDKLAKLKNKFTEFFND
jgi:superfamily II DNA or RNA helicase